MSDLARELWAAIDAFTERAAWPWVFTTLDGQRFLNDPPENIPFYATKIHPDAARAEFGDETD